MQQRRASISSLSGVGHEASSPLSMSGFSKTHFEGTRMQLYKVSALSEVIEEDQINPSDSYFHRLEIRLVSEENSVWNAINPLYFENDQQMKFVYNSL